MKKLAIIVTHPIQYYAPVFKLMAQKIELKVFYTWGKGSIIKHDPGFNKTVQWDIDLLSGYNYEWVSNTASNAGSHHFKGIINPHLIDDIKSWQPDALLIYGWAYQSHLKVMRHFKNKIPVLFRGDSTLLDDRPSFKNLFRSIYLKWVYTHIDHAFYTGTNNKAYFKEYGLRDDQLIFAPHAIDNKRFSQPRPNEVLALKQLLNLKNDELLILFTGKFEDKKDPLLLLKAFINIKTPGLHLLFVGNGILEQQLKHFSGHSNIHFMDFQNQTTMPVIYQACDIFCLPSKGPGETWGLSVNEAMACGKPILIADKVGCNTDLVKTGVNGFIFAAGALTDLTAKLNLFSKKSKKDLSEMGGHSAEIIKYWSIEAQVHNIINYKNESNK